jgi:hypothetical protein
MLQIFVGQRSNFIEGINIHKFIPMPEKMKVNG